MNHIFGSQSELGLDYLQLLYQKPVQILPILCLVSKERSTGKTTFLKWLKTIFENNLTYLTNDSFGSQFNSDWTNKLLICMEKYDLDELDFCPLDAMYAVNQTRVKTDLTQIRRLLKNEWRLSPKENSLTYEKFAIWNKGDITREPSTGRFYTVKKDFLLENFDELMRE